MARWNQTDPFPNSEVKRCCGDDSLGVAPCQNSSMPGLLLKDIAHSVYYGVGYLVFVTHGIVVWNFHLILDMKSTNIQHTKYFVSPFDRCLKNGHRNRKAHRGEIAVFTGINPPYEPPNKPDLRVETSELAIEDSIEQLLEYLGNKFTISK